MVALPSSPIRVQGTADGVPTNTETGRQRKSSHGLLALRRSTTTPTTILASAVDLTPHLQFPTLGNLRGPRRLCRADRDLCFPQGIQASCGWEVCSFHSAGAADDCPDPVATRSLVNCSSSKMS